MEWMTPSAAAPCGSALLLLALGASAVIASPRLKTDGVTRAMCR